MSWTAFFDAVDRLRAVVTNPWTVVPTLRDIPLTQHTSGPAILARAVAHAMREHEGGAEIADAVTECWPDLSADARGRIHRTVQWGLRSSAYTWDRPTLDAWQAVLHLPIAREGRRYG